MLQVREEKIGDSKLANLGFRVSRRIKKSGRNKQSEVIMIKSRYYLITCKHTELIIF